MSVLTSLTTHGVNTLGGKEGNSGGGIPGCPPVLIPVDTIATAPEKSISIVFLTRPGAAECKKKDRVLLNYNIPSYVR